MMSFKKSVSKTPFIALDPVKCDKRATVPPNEQPPSHPQPTWHVLQYCNKAVALLFTLSDNLKFQSQTFSCQVLQTRINELQHVSFIKSLLFQLRIWCNLYQVSHPDRKGTRSLVSVFDLQESSEVVKMRGQSKQQLYATANLRPIRFSKLRLLFAILFARRLMS